MPLSTISRPESPVVPVATRQVALPLGDAAAPADGALWHSIVAPGQCGCARPASRPTRTSKATMSTLPPLRDLTRTRPLRRRTVAPQSADGSSERSTAPTARRDDDSDEASSPPEQRTGTHSETLTIRVETCTDAELELVEAAQAVLRARRRASQTTVCAGVLTGDGTMYLGLDVVSRKSSICAEPTAIARAHLDGAYETSSIGAVCFTRRSTT